MDGDCQLDIYRPNGTVLINNLMLTVSDMEYQKNLLGGNFSQIGIYNYRIDCNGTYTDQAPTPDEDYYGGCFINGLFEVTATGKKLTTEIVSIYLASLLALMVLFALMILMAYQLPNKDATDEEGTILQVSNLKHLRSVLWACSWTVILAIMFILSNITLAYLPTEMIGGLFFAIYTIMFWITIIGIPVWFIWIFTGIFRDKEVKAMIERGVDIKSTP